MVRIELIADFGKTRGMTFSGIVVDADYNAIMTAGANKLRLPKKKAHELHLVLRDKYQGTRLLTPQMDLRAILRDGATIVLTSDRPTVKLQKPPRWPWPVALPEARSHGDDASNYEASSSSDARQKPGSDAVADVTHRPPDRVIAGEELHLSDWHGPWPVLQGNVLPLLREAIGKTKGFLEKDMGSYIAFDYYAANASELREMFPDMQCFPRKSRARLLAAVRRECRGLLVSAATGVVLARRLPKFFNIDELEETSLQSLPRCGGEATRKLDGSLVAPVIVDGAVRWAGKAAIVPALEAFVLKHPRLKNAEDLVRQGFSPIFEWCEAGPPVGVIRHDESRLVLLAVRNATTGEFWPRQNLLSLGCEVVESVPFEDLSDLFSTIRQQICVEGVVVTWREQGCLVKLKSSWWVSLCAAQRKGSGQPAMALHSALQSVPLSSIPSATVWQAALAGDDDQMSLVYGVIPPEAQATMRAFAAAIEQGIRTLDQEMHDWAECVHDAAEADISSIAGGWPPSLLAAYQRKSPGAEKELRKFLLKMAGAGQLPGVEALIGTAWNSGQQVFEYCSHLGTFEKAPAEVVSHVLNNYLPEKLRDYMVRPMCEETVIRVVRLYDPAEGKLKGFWEQFVDQGIIDLRVDLQPRGKVFDFHGGDADFAHWQVQFGPNDSCRRSTKGKDGDRRGAFAGVLVRTNTDVEYGQLKHAFELSFKSQKVVKLDPTPSHISHIFLDLDGVLVDFDAGFEKVFVSPPDAKQRWQHIERTPGFYDALPWIDDARRLWEHVRQLGVSVSILTGVPEGSLGERSAAEKAAWVARELGSMEVICCLSREKPQHSGPGRLLIDDRPQKGWEAAGGRQIVHRNVPETLFSLVDLGLGRRFSVARDRISLIDRITPELQTARAEAQTVAIDAEWPPDRAGVPPSQATVLQLAFQPSSSWSAFVIDLLAWDDELKDFIRELLSSDLPKLVFGPGDADRLHGMRTYNVIDLQDGSSSLANQARSVGLQLNKSKHLQAADWSARPLRDEQVVYAANDAVVLLELTGGRSVKQVSQVPSSGRNATVEYVGVFLTPEARRKLLRNAPPHFSDVVADHMTLEWLPNSVKGLAVGMPVKIMVEGEGCNETIHAVSVTTKESHPRSGHVTISHRSDVASVTSIDLSFTPIEPFVLDGVIGVGLILGGVDKDMLPGSISSRVQALNEGQPGESEQFENLTDSQRYALHILADELGLEHRSEGKKGTQYRKFILTVPKRRKKAQACVGAKGERAVVKDARKFAAIFGDVPGLRLHGRVKRNGIAWEPGIVVPPVLERLLTNSLCGEWMHADRLVIVMRGFPGSGKSSLAAIIRRQLATTEVISADDFWAGTEHLQDAHEQCHQRFVELLKAQRPIVIIDNTNVRKSDYAFYQARAESEGYVTIVLEMVCDSTADLEQLRKRSTHSVPGGAVGAMWARWELDPAALRLAPYISQEFLQWLREHNMVGHPPHTHLVMPCGPFLSIPVACTAEFHERHAAEWGNNYISEIGRPLAFQLFFDIDGLALSDLLSALPELRNLVDAPLVVTGIVGPPPGYHIFALGRVVDSDMALALRRSWIDAVPKLEGYVDGQLYKSPQLRLLGSRKISKDSVDTGRVHEFVGRFDDKWVAGSGTSWAWSEVSIHPQLLLQDQLEDDLGCLPAIAEIDF